MSHQDAAPLSEEQRAAWTGLLGLVELLPGVLDTQLQRDSAMTHFEFQVLATLSEAPEQTLRMTALATQTNATLPRLSHVITRLEKRELVRREPCAEDGRATNAVLTEAGREEVHAAAPGHLATVRDSVIDALSAEQLSQLAEITGVLVNRLEPGGKLSALCSSVVAAAEAAEARAS